LMFFHVAIVIIQSATTRGGKELASVRSAIRPLIIFFDRPSITIVVLHSNHS